MLSLRLVGLYSRSRFVPATLVAVTVGALSVLPLDDGNARLVSMIAGLGAAAASSGLGGADVQLERTGAISWPAWRFAHLALAVLVITGGVFVAGLGSLGLVLRDTGGLIGLAALGATVLGSQLAWVVPFVWTVIAVIFPVDDQQVLMWMIQPADSAIALVVAAVLGVGGATAYVLAGPRG